MPPGSHWRHRWQPVATPNPEGDSSAGLDRARILHNQQKEAPLAEDTNCASWALKGGILKVNVID